MSRKPPSLEEGIAELRAERVKPTAGQMEARTKSLPDKLRKVARGSFQTEFGYYIVKESDAIFKLSPADQRKIFAAIFPEYAEAIVAGLADHTAFPTRYWYPYRAPKRPQDHLTQRSDWWARLALLRLEFPERSFAMESLVTWAAYAGLGAETDETDAIGRLFAAIIRAGGKTGKELLDLLETAFDPKSAATLPGGHVFLALWGSGDPSAVAVLHKGMLDKRFAKYRRQIFTAASRIAPGQLVPLIGLILENQLLADPDLLERLLDLTSLGKVFERISAKKGDRDKAFAYLAQKLTGKKAKPIAWVDAWWEAWQAAIVDVDTAVPLMAKMTASDDNQVRLAGLALAEEARVSELLKKAELPKAKSAPAGESLADVLQSLNAMATVKAKLPEAKRKERIVEMAKLYERATGDVAGLKKLGKLKTADLFDRIVGQWKRHWKDESFALIEACHKARPFDLNRIVPADYVISDEISAQMLVDDIKLDFDVESLYDDTFSSYQTTIAALLRSDLSPAIWLHFIKHIHGDYLPLPTVVTKHLGKLSSATITYLVDSLSADKSSRHRVAGLKVAVALAETKHKSLLGKLRPKLTRRVAKASSEEADLRDRLAGL